MIYQLLLRKAFTCDLADEDEAEHAKREICSKGARGQARVAGVPLKPRILDNESNSDGIDTTMSAVQELVQALLSPSPWGLAIAVLVALLIPVLLHYALFRASGLTTLPSILIAGPSGSGKTALLTLVRDLLFPILASNYCNQFERGSSAATHTSQAPIAVECSLPVGTTAGSDKYRSVNDTTNQVHKKFLLIDTPGHGKLRHHAVSNITSPQNLKGIIFLVDAATLSAGDEGLRQAADYLHDVLLLLQKRKAAKSAKTLKEVPVLVAANKMDLFTALPAALVTTSLEAEITKVRTSRSKGLLDSGIGMGEAVDDDKDDWLGEMGSSDFRFAQMEEFDISVEVAGGNVQGGEGENVEKWWKWVSERL